MTQQQKDDLCEAHDVLLALSMTKFLDRDEGYNILEGARKHLLVQITGNGYTTWNQQKSKRSKA